MKHFITSILAFSIFIITGCSLLGDKSANGFDEILHNPPFKSITDSIEKSPGDASLLLRRADRLSQNNQHDIAYYDYKKSYELKPDEATAIQYTSNLFLTGRTKDAITLLKKCVQQYPSNTEFIRRLSEAYTQAGDAAQAIALYDDLLKKDSTNFDALYEKGMLYIQLSDTPHAITVLEKSYRLQPVLQNGIALANLYAETKNPKVIPLCDALEQRDSTKAFIDPLFLKGVYYSYTKEYPKAIGIFDECIARDWKNVEPYIEKGIIFFEQKNYDEALKTFQVVTNIHYTNPDAYYWMGRCYEAIGKKDEALDYYYKAAAFDRNFQQAKDAINRLKKGDK
jgi:tetratricopeptide (TPR) repeat protein